MGLVLGGGGGLCCCSSISDEGFWSPVDADATPFPLLALDPYSSSFTTLCPPSWCCPLKSGAGCWYPVDADAALCCCSLILDKSCWYPVDAEGAPSVLWPLVA